MIASDHIAKLAAQGRYHFSCAYRLFRPHWKLTT